MMKQFLKPVAIIFGVVLTIAGCREIPPTINFGTGGTGDWDTTYVNSSAPAAVMTEIYIEDITGVKCNNCPRAADKIKEIKTNNPGKVVSLGVYTYALDKFTAPWTGFDTLNTNEATDIYNVVYKSPSLLPTGGVNRALFSGETSLYFSYNKWSGYSDLIKVKESPAIINGQILSYDSVSRKAKIRVKVEFSKAYTEPLNLTVYLTESKIISKQLMPTGHLDSFYEHNHALRKTITSYEGIPLKIDSKTIGKYELGRTFERDFEFVISKKWAKENCGIIALVNRFDVDSKEVVQATEFDF
jgi:hypothetical protein